MGLVLPVRQSFEAILSRGTRARAQLGTGNPSVLRSSVTCAAMGPQNAKLAWFVPSLSKELRVAALFFDIDGTLWDATGPVSEAWDLVASKSKHHFHISQKQIFPCMGRPMSDFPKMLFPPMEKEEAEKQ